MDKTKTHKIIIHVLVLIFTTVFYIGMLSSSIAYATEKTGRIISEIVNNMNDEVQKLETFVEKTRDDTDATNKTLDSRFNEFTKTENAMQSEKIKADILLYSARLNSHEIKEVKAYMGTVATLIPMMTRLDVEHAKLAAHGFKNKATYEEFKEQVGTQLVNSMRMINQLKKNSGKGSQGIPAIEQVIVSLSKMHSDKHSKQLMATQPFKNSIADLENTFAQFESVRQRLEKEKFLLKHDNLTQLARLGMLRLTKGKMNINKISAIPNYMQASIEKRQQRYMEVMNTHRGNTSSIGDYASQSSENEDILAKIADGNPFDN